jgi:hypothetical protein
MMKIFALAAALILGPAAAQAQTINNLMPGAAVGASDLYPTYQGANPATSVPASAIKTFVLNLPNNATEFLNGQGNYITAITQITFGNGASGGVCTTTCVVNVSEAINSLTGSNPAILTAAWGEFSNLNNASAQTPTIAEAGTTGFPAGSFFDIANTGAGVQTLTPGGGTVGGASTLAFPAGSATVPRFARLVSDGISNYQIAWSTLSFTTGPASSTSGDLASFNGTTGLALQDSGVASNNLALLTGTQIIAGAKTVSTAPIFSSITGSTQCLQVNTSGQLAGSGAGCGGGGTITAGTTATSGITSGNLIGSTSNLVVDSLVPFANFPVSSTVNGDIATFSNTTGKFQDSGTLLSALAPKASPTFTGTVTIPTPFTLGAVSVTATGTQLNYLASATGTTGTTSSNVVFSTSPTISGLMVTGSPAITNAGTSTLIIQTGSTGGSSAGAITIQPGSVSASTGNGGSINLTAGVSSGGTGNGGSIVLTTGTTVGGSPGTLQFVNLAQSSAAQSGTLCFNTSGNAVTYDATLGCLTSLEELKDIHGPITGALAEVVAMKPFWFTPINRPAGSDLAEQPGFGAHQIEAVDKRLVGYDEHGNLRGVRYMEMTAMLAAAIQDQQAEIEDLKRRVH